MNTDIFAFVNELDSLSRDMLQDKGNAQKIGKVWKVYFSDSAYQKIKKAVAYFKKASNFICSLAKQNSELQMENVELKQKIKKLEDDRAYAYIPTAYSNIQYIPAGTSPSIQYVTTSDGTLTF